MAKVKKEILKDVLIPLGTLVAAVILWQIFAMITHARVTPSVTFGAVFAVLGEAVFWRSLGASLLRAFISFFVSFVAAFALAVAASRFDLLRRIVAPVVTALRSVPTMAMVLLFIVTVTANVTAVLVGTLVLFPTFYAALLPVADGINNDLVEISLVCGAGRLQRLRYVYIPCMAPAAVENGISGLSLSLKLVVSAEVLAQTARSIGMMMQDARSYLQIDRLLALTIIIVVICILIDGTKAIFAPLVEF